MVESKFKIQENMRIHNEIGRVYDLKHTEIYNDFEQNRLNKFIRYILHNKRAKDINVLDFGSGTGNVSSKFIKFGCSVVAADVSIESLKIQQKKIKSHKLKIMLLKGNILPFPDNYFDVVCAYSVLHHVPNYFRAYKELYRVLKKKGILYVDHEASDCKWSKNKVLKQWYKLTRKNLCEHIIGLVNSRELFSINFFRSLLIAVFIDKRHKREGDLHIWPDDHMNWKKMITYVKRRKGKVLLDKDYLLYRPKASINQYNKAKANCADTKILIIQKNY